MKYLKWLAGFLVVSVIVYILIDFYPFIFSRRVTGVVIDVQKVELSNSILTRPTNNLEELHSYAVAIKESSGEIVTSSAVDRQWAVVKAGQCVEAKYFPYAPWELEKSGTYHGARLIKLSDCTPSDK